MAIKVKSNKKQRWRIPRGLGAHSILDSVKLVTRLNSRPPHCPDAGKTALENGRSAFFISFSIFFSLPENLGYFQVLTRHRGPQAFWQQEPVLWKIFPRTGVGGQFWDDSSALHLLCILFLLLLPKLHLRSSSVRLERLGTLGPGDCGQTDSTSYSLGGDLNLRSLLDP